MSLSNGDFDYIRKLVYEHSAMVLEDNKGYLVESRLALVVRREGFVSLEELIAGLRAQPFNGLHWKVIEAMTINETSFFRDIYPFEALKDSILPDILKQREAERELRIWCAACSSGQEPYTIAMLLREHFPGLCSWKVKLIASDLSKEVIERAREGCYSQMEVNRGMPAKLVVKYFQRIGVQWQISEEIRRMVEFCQINLLQFPPAMPAMDIIFMRNVLIYFDQETKKSILGKARRLLRPGGYLFLGGAETTINLDDSFEKVPLGKTTCYQAPSH